MRNHSFTLFFAAVAAGLCLAAGQVDLSEFSCPDTCSTSTRNVERDCVKFGIIGCFPRSCRTDDGRSGVSCTMPTPVPTACPAVCKPSRRTVTRECSTLSFLKCSVESCGIPDPDGGIDTGGFSCVDPTPTPTACTDTCRGTRSMASEECARLELLGCSVQSCIIDIPGEPSKLGFSCATPTPTPTSCPNVCMAFEAMSRQQCRGVSGLGLGCRVQRCAGGRGFVCGTPLPTPSPSPAPLDCPSRCRLTETEAETECGGTFASLGCAVRECRRLSAPDSTGFSCVFPTPTPVGCPDMCETRRGRATRACRGLPDSLGCEVRRCDRGFGPQMFTCASPTPTPTACPGICYADARTATEECIAVRRLGLDCAVEECLGSEGSGFSCGMTVIDPEDEITIDGETVGDSFKLNLNLSVVAGGGVSREDIYLLTDTTGSMSAEIAAVQANFMDVVAARSSVSDDVQFGIGEYRDETEFSGGFRNLMSITDNIANVQSAIAGLSAGGGGDGPEANLVALFTLATETDTIGWREGARRIIVWLGDFIGHEPTCLPTGMELTRSVVADALNDEEITVVALSFTPGLDTTTPTVFGCPAGTTAAGTGQASFIASNTGGALVDSTSSTLIDTIEDTVGSLSLTFDADTSECDEVLSSTYDPSLPVEVDAGSSITVCQMVSLLPGACDMGPFTCQIRYTASGADMGALTVRVSDVRGCS